LNFSVRQRKNPQFGFWNQQVFHIHIKGTVKSFSVSDPVD
jgi:hypothetical protein